MLSSLIAFAKRNALHPYFFLIRYILGFVGAITLIIWNFSQLYDFMDYNTIGDVLYIFFISVLPFLYMLMIVIAIAYSICLVLLFSSRKFRNVLSIVSPFCLLGFIFIIISRSLCFDAWWMIVPGIIFVGCIIGSFILVSFDSKKMMWPYRSIIAWIVSLCIFGGSIFLLAPYSSPNTQRGRYVVVYVERQPEGFTKTGDWNMFGQAELIGWFIILYFLTTFFVATRVLNHRSGIV